MHAERPRDDARPRAPRRSAMSERERTPSSASRPASAGPSVRRLVSAAPSALPTLTAPAAARPALPARRAARRVGRGARSVGPHAVAAASARSRSSCVESRSYCSAIRCANAAVLDRDVELVVAHPAREVEVGRADARPEAVGDRASSRAASCRSTRTRARRRRAAAVAGARHRRQRRDVARARHQQAHVDAVARGRGERLHIRAGADEIRVGEPQVASRDRRDRQVEPIGARPVGHARDHAQRDVAGLGDLRADRRGSSGSSVSPATSQTCANARCSSATAGPSTSMPVSRHGSSRCFGIAEPLLADAQARHEADAAVDGDRLAVVAREPRERAREAAAG